MPSSPERVTIDPEPSTSSALSADGRLGCGLAEAITHARRARDRSRALTDRHLGRICREHPGHAVPAEVMMKVLLIGRGYAAGLERSIRADGSGRSGLLQATAHLTAHAEEIDLLLEGLPSEVDRLSARVLEPVLRVHGRLVEILRQITRDGKSTRSFASKYLHFHRPVFPIFDQYVVAHLPRLLRSLPPEIRRPVPSGLFPAPQCPPIDRTYQAFVERMWQLQEAASAVGAEPTVKELDFLILQIANHPWTS